MDFEDKVEKSQKEPVETQNKSDFSNPIVILKRRLQKIVDTNKEKRKLKFMDVTSARDFLFHLKRLHHLWNRSQGRHDDTPAVQVIDKTLFS